MARFIQLGGANNLSIYTNPLSTQEWRLTPTNNGQTHCYNYDIKSLVVLRRDGKSYLFFYTNFILFI